MEEQTNLVLHRTESQAVTNWARWHVLDAGVVVGFVGEEHEWLGHAYGPATYYAVHNPTGADWAALWRSEGHPTPTTALRALAEHLDTLRRP